MLPFCCQSLSKFACSPHKYWFLMIVWIIQTLNCKVVLWCSRLLFAVERREFCLNSTCCVDFMKIVLSFYCQHNNSTPQHIIPNMLIPILSFQAQMILRLI